MRKHSLNPVRPYVRLGMVACIVVVVAIAAACSGQSPASESSPQVATPAGAASPGVALPANGERYIIVPAESQVVYRVGETFIREGNRFNVAVGTTNAMDGEIVIDQAQPRNSKISTITIDISRFKSDSDRRDNAIRDRWLESSRFPKATFTPTAIEGLPATYAEGRELSLRVTGNLKVREVKRPTTFDVKLRLQGNSLSGTATATVKMTDFGFDPPSILGILKAQDEVQIEMRFIARPVQ